MTAESSLRRRGFQGQFLDYLAAITRPAMCVTGDLNVVEPGHRPPLEGFEDHDYAFYTRLTQSGLDDAYRYLNPDGTDHSWASDRLGGQRLDHALISPAAGTIRECRYDHAPRTRRLTDHAALLITVGPDADR
jgi:exonuclease III